MLLITIQETENGYYIREEYQDECDVTDMVVHVCFGEFRDLVERLGEVFGIEQKKMGTILSIIKTDGDTK